MEYDKNDPVNERFYQEARTATVSIKERNFAADDVEFLVTGTDGVRPVIGEWTSEGTEDETVHRCQVTFSEDGEYTFSVKFQDKAGNQAAYDRIDEFVIDQTAPVLTVQWDTEQKPEWQLLCKGRQALIQVEERILHRKRWKFWWNRNMVRHRVLTGRHRGRSIRKGFFFRRRNLWSDCQRQRSGRKYML